ncbi:MAG: hypothetical protein AB1568_10495 [Thermodesulfobacteriota bacterium]
MKTGKTWRHAILPCAMGMLASLFVSGCVATRQPPAPPQPGGEAATTLITPPAPVTPPDRQAAVARKTAPEAVPTDSAPPASPVEASSPETVASQPSVDPAQCYQFQPAGKKRRRCEPQSLIYGRCRSSITTCRLGRENGPLTWFACEKKRGNTSLSPKAGAILILAANRHGMPTGHVFYVEAVKNRHGNGSTLILSHTNYDRKCSLETGIEAEYDATGPTLDIKNGAWASWGRGLPVAGFILE